MIALFLDYSLSPDELLEVELAVSEPVKTRKIPWLKPVRADSSHARTEPDFARLLLERLKLPDDKKRVLLVIAEDASFTSSLAEAIRQQTGSYPLLIQPSARRRQVGQSGPLRIIDMEAYYLGEDSAATPPWVLDDSLLPPDL